MTFDKNFILENIAVWITDATIKTINKKYIYKGNNLPSNLGEKSKSYMMGQFYYDDISNTVYLSLLLDPNIMWGYKYKAYDVYMAIIEYFERVLPKSLLNGLRIEFLYSEQSGVDIHELKTKCRSEETNIKVYDDTIYLWKNIHGKYMFIRDSGVLIDDKYSVMCKTGKVIFNDYREEVRLLNQLYPDLCINNDALPQAFEEYIPIYQSYFGRTPKVIDDSEIVKFYLLNLTDYSIWEDKS